MLRITRLPYLSCFVNQCLIIPSMRLMQTRISVSYSRRLIAYFEQDWWRGSRVSAQALVWLFMKALLRWWKEEKSTLFIFDDLFFSISSHSSCMAAIIVRSDWQTMLFHLKCSFVCIYRNVLYVSFSQRCFLLTPTARLDCAESFWKQVEAWPLLTDMEYRYLTRRYQPRSFSTRYWVSIRYRWTALFRPDTTWLNGKSKGNGLEFEITRKSN